MYEPTTRLLRAVVAASLGIPCLGIETWQIVYAMNSPHGTSGFWALVTFGVLIVPGLFVTDRFLVRAGNELDFNLALRRVTQQIRKRYGEYYHLE